MKINKRAFISFDEPCKYNCKFCYTYDIQRHKIRSPSEIIESISDEVFDVIYVSQKNDNFSDPIKGIGLCKKAFDAYKSNIFIITRNVFNEEEIAHLLTLKKTINLYEKELFIAVSMNSLSSYTLFEDSQNVPSPQTRIAFIKKLSNCGFRPIVMLRPIFPNSIIPIEECLQIISEVNDNASCIIASELGVNDSILSRLGFGEDSFIYKTNQEYLQGAIDSEIRFIDVSDEIRKIKEECHIKEIPFFEHSIPALNYLLENDSFN